MTHRIGTLLGVAAGAALLCTAACERDQPAARAERPEVEQPGASRPIARPPSPRRDSLVLESWPADTQAMFGIDMVQFRESPLGGLVNGWLRSVVDGCGNHVAKQVDHVLVVMRSPMGTTPIYVLSGPSRRKVERCGSHASVWLDDTTLAIAHGLDQAELAAAAGGKERTNPRLMAAVSHIDTGAAMWVAAASPPGGGLWTEDFDEMRGTIVVKDGLKASFKLNFTSNEKAASAAEGFERTVKQMPPFTNYFEHSRARTDGTWLLTEIVMSREQLSRIPEDPMFSGLYPSPPKDDIAVTRQ